MTSYPTRGGSFRHFLRSFLQDDGSRFGEVLTNEQIERAAQLQNLSFGMGANDIYSLPLTLWAFVTQVASESKSCVAAVARVLAWLTSQGRSVGAAGTGAYCKARDRLPEEMLCTLAQYTGQGITARENGARFISLTVMWNEFSLWRTGTRRFQYAEISTGLSGRSSTPHCAARSRPPTGIWDRRRLSLVSG